MGKFAIFTGLLFLGIVLVSPLSGAEENSTAVKYLERARILYERSDYDSLPYYYRVAGASFMQLGQYDRSADCMLGMVDYYRMMNRQSAAISLLDSAESLIESHYGRDSESWANALYIRAKLYTGQNRHRESIELLNSCLDLQLRLGVSAGKMASAHSVLGAAYYTLGDMDSAEMNYRHALETCMEASSAPSVEKGILLFNIGLVYSRRNDQQKWAEYTSQGIENNILLFGPDFPDLAGYYNSLSSYYMSKGRLDSSRHYLDKAESILVKAYGNENYKLSKIYINRARLYRYEGNFQTSLEYYLESLRILESQEIPDRSLSNVLYVNIGNLYSSTGDYQTACRYLEKLLEAEGVVHPARMASFFIYLADIHIMLGNYSESEKYFLKAFAIRDEYFSQDYYGLAYDYMSYATLMDSTKRSAEAEVYFLKALSIVRRSFGDHHYQTARILKAMGDHFYETGSYGPALEHYQKAIHSLVPDYNITDLDHNPGPAKVADLLFYLRILKQKAAVLETLANILPAVEKGDEFTRAAFSTYLFSVQVIELLRTSYLNDESKLYLSENERNTYEKGVQTAFRCFELSSDPDYLKHAFQIAERAKYATLQSVLHREDALKLSGIPDSLWVLEASMKKQLSVYQELLMESLDDTLPDQVELQHYKSEVFRLKDQIAGLQRYLESNYPDYYELLYNQEVVDPGVIARNLRRNEKVIEYFIAGDELYIFEIDRSGFSCSKDSVDSTLIWDMNLVEGYIAARSIRDTIQDYHFSFIESAIRLHKRLIPPSADFRNLIIIPEGKLAYFPFDILITESVPEFSGLFSQVPFLIRSHTIRYGYSSSLLSKHRKAPRRQLKRLIAFAPGYITLQDELAERDTPREVKIDRSLLEALPGSIDEVTEIGKLLGGEVYTGSSATEERFKELAGESHIIHLATHAFLDDEDPLKSKLVFSDDPGGAEDGLLNVYELYNMDLKAGLVVLSACNTGRGQMRGGEGIMSLARAFFYAGVPNIVMTLWTVSDRQSSELMLGFYKHLIKGRKVEISLRDAKLEYIDNALPEFQNPRYWAGYILVGNPDKLFFPQLYRKLILAAVILLLLLTGIIVVKKAIKKRMIS